MSLSSTSEPTADAGPHAARQTRIDPAHRASHPPAEEPAGSEAVQPLLEIEEPSPELSAAVAGLTVEARREQLHLQVSQLAGHLRQRLREVDRRESQVNARASQLEADLRAGRLWLREREHEFEERETDLLRRIEELEEHLAARTAGHESAARPDSGGESVAAPIDPYDIEMRCQALAEREHAIRLKEDEVRERRFDVERQAAALRHAQQLWEQERERELRDLTQDRAALVGEAQQRVRGREDELSALADSLRQQSDQLDEERHALGTQRRAWEERRLQQQRLLAERERAIAAEAADRAQRLDARQEWIERQKAGLDQVHGEVLGLHRQSLEMRLIAEQIWAQLCGRMAPSEVTHAIAQTRLKLSEHYKLEEASLNARRAELVDLGERIAAQHAELKQLQMGLREWAASREAEIEQQAQAIVERELALDAEHDRLREIQQQWLVEHRRYEQQIAELAAPLSAPAAA